MGSERARARPVIPYRSELPDAISSSRWGRLRPILLEIRGILCFLQTTMGPFLQPSEAVHDDSP